jgi:hypothetical protein
MRLRGRSARLRRLATSCRAPRRGRRFRRAPTPRRCRLCTAGEHALAATHVVSISVAGSDREASVRVASPPTRRKRKEEERASRALAFPAGTWKEQMARIEAPDAGLEKHRERHP